MRVLKGIILVAGYYNIVNDYLKLLNALRIRKADITKEINNLSASVAILAVGFLL